MVPVRFRAMANTVLVVSGALLIGQVLHVTVVTNQAPLTASLQLTKLAVGAVFVGVGWLIGVPPDEQVPEGEVDADADTEFDPEMSPVGEELSGGQRRDEDN